MSVEVARLDLRLRRRSSLAYAAGVGAYPLLIVVLYPSFRNDNSLNDLSTSNPKLAALFGAAGSLTSPDGWMNANLYANFVPLFALLMTIGYGASAVAGQDEEGTLGGVASLPITRRRLLLEKTAALAVLSLPVPVVSFAASLVGNGFELDLGIGVLTQVTISSALMAFDLGLLALAVGAWSGSRGTALGVAVAAAALGYVISSLAPVVHWIHAIRYASPVYWGVGGNPLLHGVGTAGTILLVLTAAVIGVLAWAGFRRLDIH
jgi:ABC-2 type transport system permease protein